MFRRGQAVSTGLLPTGKRVVVRTAQPNLLDVGSGRVDPIKLPAGAEPSAIAATGDRLVALTRGKSAKPVLFEHRAGTWHALSTPADLSIVEKQPVVVAVNDAAIVILNGKRLHRFSKAGWTSVDVPQRPSKRPGWPKHAVLHAGRLYVGTDSGEWGGELLSLDLAKHTWRPEPPTGTTTELDLPIRDLTLDRKGRLWVVRGLSHLGLYEGMLHRLGANGFELIASSKKAVGKRPAARGGDWNLDGTAFDAIAFDAQNRPLVLTGSLGVVRRAAGGGWTRLTPSWPDFVYVQGLAVVGETAVIGTYDAGVVLFELGAGAARTVTLEP